MNYRQVILWILMGFLLPTLLPAQSNQEQLDKYFTRKMNKADLIGLQVAFVSKNSIWQGNYGIKKLGTQKFVNDSTLFMIASSSKPITAFGILQLAEKGKIKLDDPINNYLPFEVINPNFPKDVITFRMLLTHTSSIKDNWSTIMPLYTLEEGGDSPILLGDFVREYLVHGGKYYDAKENFWTQHPATQLEYCNVGYALLGHLIENISGLPFKEYIQQEIFDPLGMQNTYWFLNDIPHENIAQPHDMPHKKSDFSEPKILPHFGYPDYPDGQIRTTASDYGCFLQMLINQGRINGKSIAKEETINEFIRIQYPEVDKYQAIAWNYNEFENPIYYMLMPRLPSHTGADPGVATAVSFDPDKKIAAIVFTNSPPMKFIQQKIFYQEMMRKLLKVAKRN